MAPITILVGENSTGKTSFLASFRALHDMFNGGSRNPFNDSPFFLGSFDEIAYYRGGRGGRAKEFEIGLRFPLSSGRRRGLSKDLKEFSFSAKLARRGSQPQLSEIVLSADQYQVRVKFTDQSQPETAEIIVSSGKIDVSLRGGESPRLRPSSIDIGIAFLGFVIMQALHEQVRRKKTREDQEISDRDLDVVDTILMSMRGIFAKRPYATAPIRAKPERTYTPIDDAPDSEGSHIPLILTRTATLQKGEWLALKRELDRFGSMSGLFEDIEIRKLGKHESDPFQIEFKISGPRRNIVDVGYGVGQALPIVGDILTQPRGTTFLLQQPEVHLHPRAQAALGTFISEMTQSREHRFIIETHSDYLSDRLRRHVRQEHLKSEDLLMLYFQRQRGEVQVHVLEIDRGGRIVGAPPGYREFFMYEEMQTIGLGDVGYN